MSTQTLRLSTSHGNMRPSSSSATLGASVAPRDSRRERRKPTPPSTSPSSFSGIPSSAGIPTSYRSKSPSPPPASSARLEGSYLAAKRRAHRQSYFDHYPERNAQRRKEKPLNEEHTGEEERSEEMEKEPPLPTASVGVATRGHSQTGKEEEGDTFQTFGRATIRKSLSVGAGDCHSTSLVALGISRKGKERSRNGRASDGNSDEDPAQEEGIAFPSMHSGRDRYAREETLSSPYLQPKRSLTSTAHSRKFITPKAVVVPYGVIRDDVPTLRYSYSTYSSSQTQAETITPPQSPIEPSIPGPIEVIVAAPIPGVEAMDALVDGLEGSEEDELFKRLQASANKRAAQHHHPLYAPPLPQPPSGVVLGRSHLTRKESVSSELYDDEGEDGLQFRTTMLGEKDRASRKRHHEDGRNASSSTILADMLDRGHHQRPSASSTLTEQESEHMPPSIDEIVRKHTAVPPHQPSYTAKSTVPTIDEIIRKYTQPSNQSQPRPTTGTKSCTTSTINHNRQQESPLSDSEPEPLTPSEEAALLARSSIDSVTAEVQQTLRAQKSLEPPSSVGDSIATSNASILHEDGSSKRHSYYSYKTARSAGGCDQSIRSGSASVSASTSNGAGMSAGTPALLSDTDLPLDLRVLQQNNESKRPKQDSQKEAIATYLRSARMTTLLKLTQRPHASADRPLTVSLSDLGSSTGFPLLVFLGLGCVRYVMGLYDEMAECLGLRLITIDRWGLGRTDVPPSSASRGVPEWATVVYEVLERLNINRCSVMAHSAGAPYALAFANKYPERIVGDICLLAPWVGGGAAGGYRWLKYVPNGLLKTAQAAEWKIQAWMIGKPPKITYGGIGYDVKAPVSSEVYKEDSSDGRGQRKLFDEVDKHNETADFSPHASIKKGKGLGSVNSSPCTAGGLAKPRPSTSSGNTFSDYDDLADFNGVFDSRSTFEQRRSRAASADGHEMASRRSKQGSGTVARKRSSKGFLRLWKGLPDNHPEPVPPLPSIDTSLNQQQPFQIQTTPQPKRRLKSLKSISSIRSRTSTNTHISVRPRTAETSPILPEQSFETSLQFAVDEFGLKDDSITELPSTQLAHSHFGLDAKNGPSRASTYPVDPADAKQGPTATNYPPYGHRSSGRRSISFTSTTTSASHTYSFRSRPPLPPLPSNSRTPTPGKSSTPSSTKSSKKENGDSYQVAMGNALIAASHAESSRGTHSDLLQILNHEQRPWGFSYARYPHRVKVWYGDRDERIASESVKWMEAAMGPDRCRVSVVKGADHGLMFRTNVVVDVLEVVHDVWMDVAHGSRRREYSSRSEPMTPSAFDINTDPFKSF